MVVCCNVLWGFTFVGLLVFVILDWLWLLLVVSIIVCFDMLTVVFYVLMFWVLVLLLRVWCGYCGLWYCWLFDCGLVDSGVKWFCWWLVLFFGCGLIDLLLVRVGCLIDDSFK